MIPHLYIASLMSVLACHGIPLISLLFNSSEVIKYLMLLALVLFRVFCACFVNHSVKIYDCNFLNILVLDWAMITQL